MKRSWPTIQKWLKIFAVALPLGLSACGKQTFDKQQFGASVSANQYITIKPKVDIIVFQDISGSMDTAMNTLRPQLANFVQSINNNWDYHFAVLPLQRPDDLRGRYIIAQNCLGVSNCYSPNQVNLANSSFVFYSADTGYGNIDDGFNNMRSNLSNTGSMVSSGFLRPDAMLVVIPFTNGNDISGMSYPTDYKDRGDGQLIPNYASSNAQASMTSFVNYMTNTLKPAASLVNFFSVVAGTAVQSPDTQIPCAGGSGWPGSRYIQAANAIIAANTSGFINGGSFDLCSNQLGTVLSVIAAKMQDIVLAVEFNFIVLPERPVPGSLKIYKNGSPISNSASDGWTLYNVVGGTQQQTMNQPTSFAPYAGNNKSGYFIELHGAARFKGSDQITYVYEKF